jgi:hypothetical protein
MTQVTCHHINIYDNPHSRLIGEEMHIGYVRECALKLNNLARLIIRYTRDLRANSIEHFAPEAQKLAATTLPYKKGDSITVELEFGYIEKCLRLIFHDNLRARAILKKIDPDIVLIKGKLFWVKAPLHKLPAIDLPEFPEEEPDITFKPPITEKSFVFPPCDQKSKTDMQDSSCAIT